MNEQAAFLAAIRATPDDNTLRLAYADWLEEHGDMECSELIRVCEAMRGVPVFSDEYWRLKTRRNELRPTCPADWLAATGYDGSRYDQLFRNAVPPDLKGRWRLIREFTERWHGIPLGDVGGRLTEVRAVEQRLGRQLPPSLREYVAYANEVTSLCTGGIAHRDDFTMELRNGHSALTVMVWDGVLRWAIPYEHLSQEDPPVYAFCAAWNEDEAEHLPIEGTASEAEPLSDFILAVVDDYKLKGGRFRTWMSEDRELRQVLDASFPIRVARHRTQYVAATTIVHRVSRSQGTIYEGAGILARLHASSSQRGFSLEVCAHSSLRPAAIPGFLWEHARSDTYPEGIFRTEAEQSASADDGG
jgi:uncharacterized protein (TIGR02996 family)